MQANCPVKSLPVRRIWIWGAGRSDPSQSALTGEGLRTRLEGEAELPCTGLHLPWDGVVGSAGDVYVTDGGNNRVLKRPAVSNTVRF